VWLAWRHALDWVERNDAPFDVFVSLPATAPFRVVADVEACISMLQDHPEFDIVVTVRAAERSPYFNMVKRGADGGATLAISDVGVVRRQDAPELFDMTTIAYAARTAFIKNKGGIFEGRVGMVEIPAERALDIDTPYDLKLARLLIADTGTASLQPEK
jgi:N-acylneuraminate cytidylyltransferase